MTIVTPVPLQPILGYFFVSFFPFFLPSYCNIFIFRLDRCEQCIESLLTNDEVAWSCPGCGRLAPCPTPSTVNSTFSIEESPYALYEFDQGVTNSRDNLSSSIR